MAGFRGGRYISAEASARGEWSPGGSTTPGADAYATSKQCVLAAAMELARENPRLHVNAVEPGFVPGTNLGRESNAFIRFLLKYVLTLVAPLVPKWNTLKRAARVITTAMINEAGQTGVYIDDKGNPMQDPSGFAIRTSGHASSPRRAPYCRHLRKETNIVPYRIAIVVIRNSCSPLE